MAKKKDKKKKALPLVPKGSSATIPTEHSSLSTQHSKDLGFEYVKEALCVGLLTKCPSPACWSAGEAEVQEEVMVMATDLEPEPEEIQFTETSYTSASFESLPPIPIEVSVSLGNVLGGQEDQQ
uniref:Uncharacterized protein n=1 Tax=Heliothis virescens TaxID=7102 RepID=A0A2A4K264_HELVI